MPAQAVEDPNDPNDSGQFDRLATKQQVALVDWIRHVLVPAKRVFGRSTYGLKHDFQREPDGFYVSNGAFKGAMLAAGSPPVDQAELNWRFRIKPVNELSRREKAKKGLIGRGWLVRNC